MLKTHSLPTLLAGIMLNQEAINVTDTNSSVHISFFQKYLTLLGRLLCIFIIQSEKNIRKDFYTSCYTKIMKKM